MAYVGVHPKKFLLVLLTVIFVAPTLKIVAPPRNLLNTT